MCLGIIFPCIYLASDSLRCFIGELISRSVNSKVQLMSPESVMSPDLWLRSDHLPLVPETIQ